MARSVKHITLNVFAIKQDKRKINKLTFQLKRVQSKKPRVKGEETKLVVELIGGSDNSEADTWERPTKIKSNFKRREKNM